MNIIAPKTVTFASTTSTNKLATPKLRFNPESKVHPTGKRKK
jgi:hypothetical protein